MFAINGRLKVTLLVVGVLAVGLGMYVAFQAQEVEAHCTDPLINDWLYGSSRNVTSEGYTGKKRWSSPTTCYVCAGFYPPAVHREEEYKWEYLSLELWNHRYHWQTTWDYCHTHRSTSTETQWYVQTCQQWGS